MALIRGFEISALGSPAGGDLGRAASGGAPSIECQHYSPSGSIEVPSARLQRARKVVRSML